MSNQASGYFNDRPLPKTPERLREALEKTFYKVLSKEGIEDVEPWTGRHMDGKFEKLANCWEYPQPHFREWWAEQLVLLYGFMVSNAVFRHVLAEKRDEKKAEEKADKRANAAEQAFRKAFA